MTYSTKHLQYLVSVADQNSFSKAANLCNVTQSTLSLGIKELERQMGVLLFERSRKHIIPTPAGMTAISHARRILKTQNDLEQDIRTLADPKSGPLRIAAIPTIAPYFLPRFLPKLETIFDSSQIQIAEDPTQTILDKINKGEADLGILAFPVNIGDLEHKILFSETMQLATIESDPRQSISIDMLKTERLLLLRSGHCLKDHILRACNIDHNDNDPLFQADSLHTLLAMVNQGYGVTPVPDMAVKANIHTPFNRVKIIPFAGQSPNRDIGLVWRRTDVRRNLFSAIH